MSNLAIRGHATRGKEVIEILEMLGGRNPHNYSAVCGSLCFYIGKENNKIYYDWVDCCEDEDLLVFTLEEFLEKFPYKVGDKVMTDDGDKANIVGMVWDNDINDVFYETQICNEVIKYPKELLQPYKEETMEERKYSQLRMPLDDYDKMATEVTIDGDKITPPENYLIGKITKVDDGMLVEFVKKPQYPKTYKECCEVLSLGEDSRLYTKGYKANLIQDFQKLLICRDAYWKIAGEQMGLGKPWEPYWTIYKHKFCLGTDKDKVIEECVTTGNRILAFPTEEMRDAFYENFKELIETCREFL